MQHPVFSDVVIIGAGAAGLMCALTAGQRGKRVTLLDHAKKAGEKIRISGGGRCNFTNLHAGPENFISQNPHFCISALARYTPQDFIALVEKHGIAYHEKTLGQLFCDGSSNQIVDLLLNECAQSRVALQLETAVARVTKSDGYFQVETSRGLLTCASLVVACGGLSIPKMGATGMGYDIASQFGHSIVPTRPALVPFTLPPKELQALAGLSGIALNAVTHAKNGQEFHEGLLFTHRGVSGPAVLQISSYWQPGQTVDIDLAPGRKVKTLLLEAKTATPKVDVTSVLSQFLPKRLAQNIVARHGDVPVRRLAEFSDQALLEIAASINAWRLLPAGTEGYRTAEVTLGGVDTGELYSRTMESRKAEGLYFIGEVVDVTGQLGGFNFQWAWASGHAAGMAA